jgi:protein associated with RNAse G/E
MSNLLIKITKTNKISNNFHKLIFGSCNVFSPISKKNLVYFSQNLSFAIDVIIQSLCTKVNLYITLQEREKISLITDFPLLFFFVPLNLRR